MWKTDKKYLRDRRQKLLSLSQYNNKNAVNMIKIDHISIILRPFLTYFSSNLWYFSSVLGPYSALGKMNQIIR